LDEREINKIKVSLVFWHDNKEIYKQFNKEEMMKANWLNKTFIFIHIAIVCILFGIPVSVQGENLLENYEADYQEFNEVEVGENQIYYQIRKIDGAIVEKDFIVYRFDKESKKMLEKKINWREGLPDKLPPIISRADAEAMVEGEIQFSKLYYISPTSDVFPIKPAPKNPCWVVRSISNDGIMTVIIIDAVEGTIIGKGIPPPTPPAAYSVTGPGLGTPCIDIVGWIPWMLNAQSWFNKMGYESGAKIAPTEADLKTHIESPDTSVFYEVAHGGMYFFRARCDYNCYGFDIGDWLQNSGYGPMPFAFIGTCDGMCLTDTPTTLSAAFRQSSDINTVTVGYCHMSRQECDECWDNSLDWQDKLFTYINNGETVKDAFDQALSDMPFCLDCMRFVGDETLKLVPKVTRSGLDYDQDGWYEHGAGYETGKSEDCDDACASCYPGASEIAGDRRDNDCDGKIDEPCFIATAAYGTPCAKDIQYLRKFRDQHLLKNNIGKKFVGLYYKYSPPLAEFISDKPKFRAVVRFLLKPLVWVSEKITK